jgi:hypothetical protein
MQRLSAGDGMSEQDHFEDIQRASRKSAIWTFVAFVGVVVTLRIGEPTRTISLVHENNI